MAGSETEVNGTGTPVFALAADLMFASRIRGAAQACGADVTLVRSGSALEQAVRAAGGGVVLLDLEARGIDVAELIGRLRAAGAHVTGFVSHVRTDLIGMARAAGAERVMARSAFVQALPALLGGRAADGV